jgi:hypothetical protein
MSQLIIKQELKAGDSMDILNQYFTGKLRITITLKDKRVIEIGYLKDLEPTRYGIKGNIAFLPGKHVRGMKGKNHEGFLFERANNKWVINKTE